MPVSGDSAAAIKMMCADRPGQLRMASPLMWGIERPDLL
jgi:hypothetical protein